MVEAQKVNVELNQHILGCMMGGTPKHREGERKLYSLKVGRGVGVDRALKVTKASLL